MPVNFTFLAMFLLPLLAVGLALLVFGIATLVGEIAGWIYGR